MATVASAATDRTVAHSTFADLVELTKPRITLLVLVTMRGRDGVGRGGCRTSSVASRRWSGMACASGGGAVLNHVVDRDIDRLMSARDAAGRHRPRLAAAATAFGIALNALAVRRSALFANVLAAVLALAGSAFYVVVYTMVLKRRTPQNIVIGGAAGAIPPLVGWAAVTGSSALAPLVMFVIIFLWTPPHFWALAILKRDDYARAGVPMLPGRRERARDGAPDPGLHGAAGGGLAGARS